MIEPHVTLAALRRGDLAGARELDLSGARLTELPAELFGLADTLEVLDVSGNRLTALPPDFSRLRGLRILFASSNAFPVLPPVLGELPELSQLGFRRAGLREVPAEALPSPVRWLTLTDNALESLPEALGERPRLQKLMLAGNRLTRLPASLAGVERLELLRVAANGLDALPQWLAELPSLAWLAWAGNPFEPDPQPKVGREIAWSDLELGTVLGEGASGRVYEAVLREGGAASAPVAVKLFKGAMTSDGLPAHEMAACLSAGQHRGLVGAIGRVTRHPDGAAALVMPRLPKGWRVLAEPPSRESCSRDVYAPGLRLELDTALTIAADVAEAAAHLHGRGLLHGDLYAHNTLWDGENGSAVLTDFGAASRMLHRVEGDRWAKLETLAWGRLLGELLDRCDGVPPQLRELQSASTSSLPKGRPSLREAGAQLGSLQARL